MMAKYIYIDCLFDLALLLNLITKGKLEIRKPWNFLRLSVKNLKCVQKIFPEGDFRGF